MKKFAKFSFWVLVFPIILTLFYMAAWRLLLAVGAGQQHFVVYGIFIAVSAIMIMSYLFTAAVEGEI